MRLTASCQDFSSIFVCVSHFFSLSVSKYSMRKHIMSSSPPWRWIAQVDFNLKKKDACQPYIFPGERKQHQIGRGTFIT